MPCRVTCGGAGLERAIGKARAGVVGGAHSLKLELAGKLPSLHDPPPAPSKHLTRCLRNRVQATFVKFSDKCFSVLLRACPPVLLVKRSLIVVTFRRAAAARSFNKDNSARR